MTPGSIEVSTPDFVSADQLPGPAVGKSRAPTRLSETLDKKDFAVSEKLSVGQIATPFALMKNFHQIEENNSRMRSLAALEPGSEPLPRRFTIVIIPINNAETSHLAGLA